MDFKQKYLKYKAKYLDLKNDLIYSNKKQIEQRGGRKNYILNDPNIMIMNNITGVNITDMAISAIAAIDNIEKKNNTVNVLNTNNTNSSNSNTNFPSNTNVVAVLVGLTIGSAAYLIFSAGGGYDLFGSLPKIYEILRLNPNAKIIVISPSFCMGECASYFANTTLDSEKSKYGRRVTDHCFEIVNGDKTAYSPEKEFFAAIKKDFVNSNIRLFNIPAWFKYDNYDITEDSGVRATAEQYIEAIKEIIKICDVKSTELKIIIQDMGSDLILNEKHLLEGNKRYGLASYVEEMTLIYVIKHLIDTNYFIEYGHCALSQRFE